MHHENPVVSVVIPTYNQADFLTNALISVRDQDFNNWEAIVIDNYSEDHTRSAVEAFGDPRIHYIPFHNHGIIAASRNKGIKEAQGKFIAFLDSDDLWYPTKISSCMACLATGKNAVCHGLQVRKNGILTPEKICPVPTKKDIFSLLLYSGNSFIATSSVMAEKKIIDKYKGFSEDPSLITAEDYDLWLRFSKDHVNWGIIPQMLGEYTIHASNASRNIRKQMLAEETVVCAHFSDRDKESLKNQFLFRRRMMLVSLHAGMRMITTHDWPSAISLSARGIYALFKKY
jgi:glycosyltransferase involved in cell wall biosynthesis